MNFLIIIRDFAASVFVGGIAASIWVVPMIDFLYRFQFTAAHMLSEDRTNAEFMKLHGHKNGTPNMAGILIWITVPIVLLLLYPQSQLMQAASFTILLVGFWGLLDGVLNLITKNNTKIRQMQDSFEWKLGKLILTLFVNIGVSYFIIQVAGVKSVSIGSFVLQLDNLIGYALVAGTSLFASYATDIVDGLDGLASGMYIISLVGFLLLIIALPQAFGLTTGSNAHIIVGAMLGVLTVFLYFNIPPARFWMGAPGGMVFGPLFLLLALYANALPAFFIITSIYFIDLATSTLQILSIKFFKRKLFRIAPIHHHFESMGWPEYKIVMRFWLFTGIVAALGILVQLFMNS